MRALPVRRHAVAAVFGGALVFGVVMSVLKGNDAGIRSDIGNLSAPWLLLPFVAGAVAGRERIARGAAIGLAASVLALFGFYLANSVVLDLGPHSWVTDLRLTLGSGRRWYELGLASGPVFGIAGSLWRRHGSRLLGVCVCSLLLAEPWVSRAAQRSGIASFWAFTPRPAVWIGETLVGVALCVLVLRLSVAAKPRAQS